MNVSKYKLVWQYCRQGFGSSYLEFECLPLSIALTSLSPAVSFHQLILSLSYVGLHITRIVKSARPDVSKVVDADEFEYKDPVDGSVSKHQGIRYLFEDGSRLVSFYSHVLNSL